jgi:hypothetical protein
MQARLASVLGYGSKEHCRLLNTRHGVASALSASHLDRI